MLVTAAEKPPQMKTISQLFVLFNAEKSAYHEKLFFEAVSFRIFSHQEILFLDFNFPF